MYKYIFFYAFLIIISVCCSSSKQIALQSDSTAITNFFINEIWDEPDCGEKQITIIQDTIDGLNFFYQWKFKEKVGRFEILDLDEEKKINIPGYKNIKIKAFKYEIATGDDSFQTFNLQPDECCIIILNGIYHFKDYSIIGIKIVNKNGTQYRSSFKYKLIKGQITDIELLSYVPKSGSDAKVDLRKKYPMYFQSPK